MNEVHQAHKTISHMWAVSTGCYSDYQVRAVFGDKKTAEKWAAALRSGDNWVNDARVEQLMFIPAGVEPFTVTEFCESSELHDSGKVERGGVHSRTEYPIASLNGLPPLRPCVRYVRAPCHHNEGGRLEVRGSSAESVLKVGSEKIAMWKAGQWAGRGHNEIIEQT